MTLPAQADTAAAPEATHRLVPSRFPPVQAFDMARTQDDLAAVLDLEGWTNDRLSETRLRRLPRDQWVHGRPNSSVVMAAFLHGSHGGLRFTGPDLGAWYAATTLTTAMTEVLNGLRREITQSALTDKTEDYREYTARLSGAFVDIREHRREFHDPDPALYPRSQVFGEQVRAGPHAGIAYDSVRDPGGHNWVGYRPTLVHDVIQAGHFRAVVRETGKVIVQRLEAS
jgi:hypothetical protein